MKKIRKMNFIKTYIINNIHIPNLKPGDYNCKGSFHSIGFINLATNFDMDENQLIDWCDNQTPYILRIVEDIYHGNGD